VLEDPPDQDAALYPPSCAAIGCRSEARPTLSWGRPCAASAESDKKNGHSVLAAPGTGNGTIKETRCLMVTSDSDRSACSVLARLHFYSNLRNKGRVIADR